MVSAAFYAKFMPTIFIKDIIEIYLEYDNRSQNSPFQNNKKLLQNNDQDLVSKFSHVFSWNFELKHLTANAQKQLSNKKFKRLKLKVQRC